MLVHADQAGNDGVAGEIHALGRRRDVDRFPDGRDFAVVDQDGLILGRRRAGSVDDANVNQRDDGVVDADKRLNAGVESRLSKSRGGEKECEEAHGGKFSRT